MKKLLVAIALLSNLSSFGQRYELIFHDNAVKELVKWFSTGDKNSIDRIASYPESVLMAEIYRQNTDSCRSSFGEVLYSFNTLSPSKEVKDYGLQTAFENSNEIVELLESIKSIDTKQLVESVNRYFPNSYVPAQKFDIFFTATGWEWGDAMQINYCYTHDTIHLTKDGVPALLFNLSIINNIYGKTIEEKTSNFRNVFAHELFHLMLSDYQRNQQNGYSNETPLGILKELMLNEGIAHYISMKKSIEHDSSLTYQEKAQKAFEKFSEMMVTLNTKGISETEQIKLIQKGTYGKFWDKHVCITGMFMAHYIEKEKGIAELQRCIKNGSDYFFATYKNLSLHHNEMPRLPNELQ